MKKERCPAWFPVFWLKQWLKRHIAYWDTEHKRKARHERVHVMCMKEGGGYTLICCRFVKLQTSIKNPTGDVKWAPGPLSLAHKYMFRSYQPWGTLILNHHIKEDKPAGNSERKNESDRKRRQGKEERASEVKCCWDQ